MSGVAELRYEYVYLSDSTTATAAAPQTALDQYQFSYAQGIMNGYGSQAISISATTPIPLIRVPNGAAVYLQMDNMDTLASLGGLCVGLNIVNGAFVPYLPGQTPTRASFAMPCMAGQVISTPMEWNAASQNASDTNVTSVQLCTYYPVHLLQGPQISQTQGNLDTNLMTTLTGKVFWYY